LFSYADITNLPPSKVLCDSEKEGLEIDLDLLMELAAVDREMIIDNTAVKFGFDTALIPLEPAKSKRWHFLVTEGKQITPERLKKDTKKWRLCRTDEVAEDDLKGNVYVGWCGNPVVKIATIKSESDIVRNFFMNSGVPDVPKLSESSESSLAKSLTIPIRIGLGGLCDWHFRRNGKGAKVQTSQSGC